MDEHDDTTPGPAAAPSADTPPAAGPSEVAAPRTRFRDRVYGARGVTAVGIAALVLGGLGGTAAGFALDDHDRGDHPFRFDRQGPGGPGGPMMGGPGPRIVPPGAPGQEPPTGTDDPDS